MYSHKNHFYRHQSYLVPRDRYILQQISIHKESNDDQHTIILSTFYLL